MRKLFLVLTFMLAAIVSASASVKYVFFFIGDGMGIGHVMAAETYNRTVLGNDQPLLMMQFPVTSMAMTYSANNIVTDSAAAGTALATGEKTNNYMIGVRPDSTAVISLASQLKAAGYGVGVVTSVAFDDATPAAQYAHQPNRNMYREICADGARSGFDFIAGAYTHDVKNSEAIFSDFADNGYAVAHGLKALEGVKSAQKILLTAGNPKKENDLEFTIDSVPGMMTLRDMTAAGLEHLLRVSPDGFYMMVEGGNIDHAGHANDGATVIKEILNFQQSIRVAYDFYLQHPEETLIVVTADHNTGGLSLGVDKGDGRVPLHLIDCQRISKDRFNDFCVAHKDYTWEEIKAAMGEKLGLWTVIPVTEDEEARMKAAYDLMGTKKDLSQKTLYKEFFSFSAIVYDILNHKYGIGFTTFSHAGNPVPVFAIGEGCEVFSRLNNNVEIPLKMKKLIDLD